MRVKVFMNSAGTNAEREILRQMHDGIKLKVEPTDASEFQQWRKINSEIGRGSGVGFAYSEKYTSCDVAVMLGSWKPQRENIHHIVRSDIASKSSCFICIETPLLGRKVSHPNTYHRVGINGFLNRAAWFGEERDYPNDRLRKLGIGFKGWKQNRGDKIIVALQLPGDASLRHNDIVEWCKDTVCQLRSKTDRPIEIRTHPAISEKGMSGYDQLIRYFAFSSYKNISFVDGKTISWQNHINNAYCVVSYTSGLSIDAVIQGIPVIACDEGNFAYNVCEHQIRNIENLKMAKEDDVQQWLCNLAYCQWAPHEMQSGECWDHLKSGVEQIINLEKS